MKITLMFKNVIFLKDYILKNIKKVSVLFCLKYIRLSLSAFSRQVPFPSITSKFSERLERGIRRACARQYSINSPIRLKRYFPPRLTGVASPSGCLVRIPVPGKLNFLFILCINERRNILLY